MAVTCTPDGLVNSHPCAKCLSQTELLAAFAGILGLLAGRGTFNLTTAVSNAACFRCLNEHQFWEAMVNALWDYTDGLGYIPEDITDLQAAAGCLFKCTDPATIRAVIIDQMCDFLDSGEN